MKFDTAYRKAKACDNITELKDVLLQLKKAHKSEVAEIKNARLQEQEAYKSRITELEDTVSQRDDTIQQMEQKQRKDGKIIKKQAAELEKKDVEISDLHKSDALHNGSNTPGSVGCLTQQQYKKLMQRMRCSTGKSPGGQEGREGVTSKPKPDKTERHELEECLECGSEDIRQTGTETRIVTETPPPPPKPETTKHVTPIYDCNDCSATGMKAKTGLPKRGEFGINIIFAIIQGFLFRMPVLMNVQFLNFLGVKIADGTISNVLSRVCGNLQAPTEDIIATLRKCDFLHADETSISFAGTKIWIWVFCDPISGATLFLLRPSRGKDVLHEVLGLDWKGIINCDGWPAYKGYKIQRCWAHLIRGMAELHVKNKEYAPALTAYRELQKILHIAKRDVKDRRRKRRRLEKRCMKLFDIYRKDPIIGAYIAKLERALPHAFEFVENPLMDPTNNYAERALRELVVHRKIRGYIKSKAATLWMGYLFSCVATWKNQGLDFKQQMIKYI